MIKKESYGKEVVSKDFGTPTCREIINFLKVNDPSTKVIGLNGEKCLINLTASIMEFPSKRTVFLEFKQSKIEKQFEDLESMKEIDIDLLGKIFSILSGGDSYMSKDIPAFRRDFPDREISLFPLFKYGIIRISKSKEIDGDICVGLTDFGVNFFLYWAFDHLPEDSD